MARRLTVVAAIGLLGVQVAAARAATKAIVPAVAAKAATKAPNFHKAAEAGRWSLLIAVVVLVVGLPVLFFVLNFLLYLFGVVVSWFRRPKVKQKFTGVPFLGIIRGAIVGADGRVSTSKSIAVVWTYAVGSGLLSIIIAKWLGHGHAYGELVKNGLQGAYAVLIGGPIGAAILAKGIVSSQVSGGASKPTADAAQVSQLVTDDSGATDLGDLQYVLFNTIALVFFFGQLLGSPELGLPQMPDVLLGLTSVSAVGYVAKKVLVSSVLGITKVDPKSAKANAPVSLYVSGLVDDQGNIAPDTAVKVWLDTTVVTPTSTALTDQGPVVEFNVPVGLAPKQGYDIKVSYNGKTATTSSAFEVEK